MTTTQNDKRISDALTGVDKRIGEDMKTHYGMNFEVFHEWGHVEFGDNDEETYQISYRI